MSAPDSKVIYSSTARTADPTRHPESRGNAVALYLVVDVTAVSVTPSVVPKILIKNAAGVDLDLLGASAITGVGTTVYHVGYAEIATPGGDVTVSRGVALPESFEVFMDHADADSITYSVELITVL